MLVSFQTAGLPASQSRPIEAAHGPLASSVASDWMEKRWPRKPFKNTGMGFRRQWEGMPRLGFTHEIHGSAHSRELTGPSLQSQLFPAPSKKRKTDGCPFAGAWTTRIQMAPLDQSGLRAGGAPSDRPLSSWCLWGQRAHANCFTTLKPSAPDVFTSDLGCSLIWAMIVQRIQGQTRMIMNTSKHEHSCGTGTFTGTAPFQRKNSGKAATVAPQGETQGGWKTSVEPLCNDRVLTTLAAACVAPTAPSRKQPLPLASMLGGEASAWSAKWDSTNDMIPVQLMPFASWRT